MCGAGAGAERRRRAVAETDAKRPAGTGRPRRQREASYPAQLSRGGPAAGGVAIRGGALGDASGGHAGSTRPTSALDPEMVGEVLKVMLDLSEAGA